MREKPKRGGPELNRAGSPRPRCKTPDCGRADGSVRWGRCKKCRARARENALEEAARRGLVDDAWVARFTLRFRSDVAFRARPGVEDIARLLAAGGRPFANHLAPGLADQLESPDAAPAAKEQP